jgi:hypothetical protein
MGRRHLAGCGCGCCVKDEEGDGRMELDEARARKNLRPPILQRDAILFQHLQSTATIASNS